MIFHLEFETDILNCLKVLRNGGLILYPTDTIWGIGCDATNPETVGKIYALKKRRGERSLIALVAEEREVLRYVAQPDPELFAYLRGMEKPTTVVYNGAIGLAPNLIGKDGSVAIRICKDLFCQHLIKRFRKPIVSTSANISGEASPENFSHVSVPIRLGVDYIVHYRQNDKESGQPSRLIKWQEGNAVVLRP